MKVKHYNSLFRRVSLLGILLLLVGGFSYAQTTVTGTVTDSSDNSPLPGVSILVKGTSTGTTTDLDGKYTLSVPAGGEILVYSYIGYSNQEVAIGNQSKIDIALLVDDETLQEVVVTGYSVDSRRETTGSVSTVKAKDLKAIPSGNVEQQLQGRVPGVTVVTNGQPGTTSQVRVRGFTSFGGNQPLYVVDGVPIESSEFLNPDDIESTTVLKDAAAASIYGARAAAGVIIFTTKKGKKEKQKMTVTYDGLVGVTTAGTGVQAMAPQEFAEWTWRSTANTARTLGETPTFSHPQFGSGSTPVIPDFLLVGGIGNRTGGVVGSIDLGQARERYDIDPSDNFTYQVVRPNLAGTDWYDAITRNAILNRHSIGVAGGGEGSRYYVGLSVQDQEATIINQKFQRYVFRANSEFDLIKDKLRIGENFQATYRSTNILFGDGGGSGSSDDENVINLAYRMPSIIPVNDEFGGFAGTLAPGFNNPTNPVAQLEGQKNNQGFSTQAFGNVYLEAEPIKNLVIRTSFGGRYLAFNNVGYARRTYENAENTASFGFNQGGGYVADWTWTNTANYKRTFAGKHKVDVLLGQEAIESGVGRSYGASGIDPFSTDTDFVTLSTVNNRVVDGALFSGIRFASVFGRLNYEYNDRYLFSAVVRRDGSSRFGTENRYGTFPAFSAAWRISSESFMSDMTWITDLKIRGGWGIMGNSNNVDPSNQFSLFGTSIGASSYDIAGINNGQGIAQGFFRSRIGNPQARWERSITTNVGFDGTFFGGKLDIIFDVWRKDTEDLLFNLPVTVQNGEFAAIPAVNIAEMRNQGIDLMIETRGNFNSDISYTFTLTGGFINNEITAVSDGLEFFETGVNYRGVQPIRNAVGQTLSTFFGYEVDGLFRDQGDVDAHATQEGAAPGFFKFKDLNNDGVINTDDRTFIGSPVPDFTGGINFKIEYKRFALEAYTFASIGNDIYNVSKLFTDFNSLFPGASISERVRDSWTFENPTGDIPLFTSIANFSTTTQSHSYYVEDGSFFRLQNVTLSYNLPESMLDKLKLQRMRLFGSVNNVFTITGYEGLDPGVGGNVDTNFGIDIGNFPITRGYTFGVNVAF